MSSGGWTGLIVILAIVLTVLPTVAIAVWVIRGARTDPDEQRWRREAAARREAERAGSDGK